MMRNWRRWLVVFAIVLLAPFGIDYASATARLNSVQMDVTLDPPQVVADGKSNVTITLLITENGQPRANDLLQVWLDIGNGFLPQWAKSDASGKVKFTFAPNPLTQYDVQDRAEIHVRDISIGRLIEVGKDIVIKVPLTAPKEQKPKSIIG